MVGVMKGVGVIVGVGVGVITGVGVGVGVTGKVEIAYMEKLVEVAS